MREILFRGKRVDNGEWVEGFYFKAQRHWNGIGVHEDWIADGAIQNGGWCNVVSKHAVIPETVGQYTGLHDSTKWEQLTEKEQAEWLENHTADEWNGKKIFEGDIVKGKDALAKGFEIYGYVDHQNGSFVIVGEAVTHYRWLDYEVEVIGNITDNPELIGGGEDA